MKFRFLILSISTSLYATGFLSFDQNSGIEILLNSFISILNLPGPKEDFEILLIFPIKKASLCFSFPCQIFLESCWFLTQITYLHFDAFCY
mgnify:CR=1 FL=1